ncbi:MAG: Tetratricopeptide repeat protein [Alphaproteobacteria bacterium ADurb.BinA280]|nr:tetratricopeptide repeat protein [Aquimonas sp.]OPZ13329.1 MAG: Tetratricopeptide repeat protein [Alphaproteobacteria bacterium ADurb.BinA280]
MSDLQETALLQRLARQPSVADWNQLGTLRLQREAFDLALTCFQQVLQLAPDHLPSRLHRAICLLQLGDWSTALDEATAIAHLVPQHPAPWRLQAESALAGGLPERAEHDARQGLLRDANDPALWHALASALDDQRRYAEALAAGEHALALAPDALPTLSMVQFLRRRLCRFEDLPIGNLQLRKALGLGEHGASPFAFLAEPADAAAQRQCAMLAALPLQPLVPNDTAAPRPRGDRQPLRIGMVSNGFGQHPTALLLVEFLACLQRQHKDIQTCAYALNQDDGSTLRQRLRSHFTLWRDVAHRDAAQIADGIRADGMDILFDLRGWGGGARPAIFARRPAPIQINWLAFPGTTGAPWMDYVLADRFVLPEHRQADFSERVLYLPDCFQPSDTSRVISTAPDRQSCGLPNDKPVLASFNNSYKFSPESLELWLDILIACPSAVLWLLLSDGVAEAATRLRQHAAQRGVAAERLIFMPKLPHDDYLSRFAHVDLFLDTTPYGAHTTASDALWAGCPVLTCPGETFASRVAGSLLHTLGVPELIAKDADDYRNRAIRLIRSPSHLTHLRSRLAQQRNSSPLFDMQRFAEGFANTLQSLR